MVSSLGLNAFQSCAASRAGIKKLTELDYCVEVPQDFEMVPVIGHSLREFSSGFSELGRLVRIGSMALRDLIMNFEFEESLFEESAIIVNLSSGWHIKYIEDLSASQQKDNNENKDDGENLSIDEQVQWYKAEIIPRMLKAANLTGKPKIQMVQFEDQPGLISALSNAKKLLETNSVKYVIVGGIDALTDYSYLDALDELELLKTPARSEGIIPGEGAAFLLVKAVENDHHKKDKPLAFLKGSSLVRGTDHRFSNAPQSGQELSKTILESLGEEIGACKTIVSHLNGDEEKSKDWGAALVRTGSTLKVEEILLPAESFGETGAAYGFMASCFAAFIFMKGCQRSDSMLIWVSSDQGVKGSLVLAISN